MPRPLHIFLVVTLALATAGAQLVCACASPAPAPEVAQPVEQPCTGTGHCCHKDDSDRPIPVSDHDPCDECNLKDRPHQTIPDPHDASPSLQPALERVLVPVVIAPTADVSLALPRLAEGVPRPPLLRDLFHVHALLLN